jgi:hypothetical protein
MGHVTATDVQHPVRFCGGWIAIPMTAPDIRDMFEKSIPRRETVLAVKRLKCGTI